MTAEGSLRRGKENYENKVFLDNPETIEYISTLEKPKDTKKEGPKEAKNAKSDK